MNRSRSKVFCSLTIAAILLAIHGCGLTPGSVEVGPLQTESQSVELGDAESVRVEIEMGAGELEVAGGADELMEADFTYNVAELKPEVVYSGDTLTIQQPDVEGIASLGDLDGYRYEWDLRLNDDVHMDLSIGLGAGTMDLRLSGLSLTALEVDIGAGEGKLDLTGEWPSDLDASIMAGVSSLTVVLPGEVGARVEIDGISRVNANGLMQDGNTYVNDVYGVSDVTLEINIEAGIGEINLELGE